MLPLSVQAQANPHQLVVCINQQGGYVADIQLFNGSPNLTLPIGRRHCLTEPAPTFGRKAITFVARAFNGFGYTWICAPSYSITPGNSRNVEVYLGGTTFHPSCSGPPN
ncbi:hypothetical protein [Falsiroseomonas tokyonensis]|uniref:Uncharacterized protein n=1 Tax=Falsiroseomonas tokyonensis TaxID=430521 RepID=A0ABV7C2P4_9PROT|nr:hypothetical protein [Falsiroseomonas tokyonensis]MBU8541353.1 hypothetical protein [Falsiroseomonas tokyonensis]